MKQVSVLGQVVKISYDDSYLKKDELAIFDSTSMRIFMREELEDSPKHDSVLIHEMCHAAFFVSGLSHLLGNEVEEAACMALEHTFKPFISFD